MTLSEQAQRFFRQALDGAYPEDAETNDARESARTFVDDIIASRETIANNKNAIHDKQMMRFAPEVVESLLDERFTRDVIDAVPGYVKRTMALSRLDGAQIPSTITNVYLREAARTYIFGLPQASIALSRAALEQALKENLGYQMSGAFVEVNALLNEAEGSGAINKRIRKLARTIANEADNVLHEKPADPCG